MPSFLDVYGLYNKSYLDVLCANVVKKDLRQFLSQFRLSSFTLFAESQGKCYKYFTSVSYGCSKVI
jgi:hypothetical protein